MMPLRTSVRSLFQLSALGVLAAVCAPAAQAADAPRTQGAPDPRWSRIYSVEGAAPVADVPLPAAGSDGPLVLSPVNSPDVAVFPSGSVTQSEISVAVHPTNPQFVFVSANATPWPVTTVWGTGVYWSTNGGTTWTGNDHGPGGVGNSGDPAACIRASDNRMLVGYISNIGGMGVDFSTNFGSTWQHRTVSTSSSQDKNHLHVDNSPSSAFVGNVYNAWSNLGGGVGANDIVFSRSTNGGDTWSSVVDISAAVASGSHDQGVNLRTSRTGVLYACWAIYDSFPADETAIGLNRSTDGGATWTGAFRAITNIRGHRNTTLPNTTSVRRNSFPSMAVDVSGGPNDGNVYICWTNIGVPGINTGTDASIWCARSTNGGTTFGTPVRVNQDAGTASQFFPWISCDPLTGQLAVVFYDRRDDPANTQARAYMAVSNNGGLTWEDFQVADVSFTPTPISGLAGGYMGDYLGIDFSNGKAYPSWPDNRTGNYLCYVSPILVADPTDPNAPTGVTAFSDFTTPTSASLDWTDPTTYVNGSALGDFSIDILRDDVLVANVDQGNGTFDDTGLTEGELYSYTLRARDDVTDSLSVPVSLTVYAGGPPIVSPTSVASEVFEGFTDQKSVTVSNPGTATMHFTATETPDVAWLTVTPAGGTLGSHGTQVVTLDFDSGALAPGLYQTDVVIDSDYPVNPQDIVHVSFTVNGVPQAHVDPASVHMYLPPLGTGTQTLTISNTGVGDLNYDLSAAMSGGASRFERTGANAQVGATLARGDVFRIDTSIPLKEIEMRLNPSANTALEFFIYENTAATGTFTKTFSVTTSGGPGLAWYSSGPINVTLTAGKYYFIGAGWQGTSQCYHDFGSTPPLPYATPFGAVTGAGIAAGYPPPSTTSISAVPFLYAVALEYGDVVDISFLDPPTGTVAASSSADIEVQFTAAANLGVFTGAFTLDSNDPVTGSINVPLTVTVDGAVDAPVVAPVPVRLALHSVAPNPFRGATQIRYDLPRPGKVSIRVFDVSGRLIRTLVDGEEPAGYRAVTWDGLDNAGHRSSAGVYFYTLRTADETLRKKMVQLR